MAGRQEISFCQLESGSSHSVDALALIQAAEQFEIRSIKRPKKKSIIKISFSCKKLKTKDTAGRIFMVVFTDINDKITIRQYCRDMA